MHIHSYYIFATNQLCAYALCKNILKYAKDSKNSVYALTGLCVLGIPAVKLIKQANIGNSGAV